MRSVHVGGTLVDGSANTINCYIDRDIDAVMKRTSRRPLVVNGQGTIKPVGGAGLGDRARCRGHAASRPDGQLAGHVAGRRGDLVPHLRVHAASEASQPVQHRDRRRGWLLPRSRRLGGGHHDRQDVGPDAVRGHLPVDPAALLGAGDEVPKDHAAANVPMLPVVASPATVAPLGPLVVPRSSPPPAQAALNSLAGIRCAARRAGATCTSRL